MKIYFLFPMVLIWLIIKHLEIKKKGSEFILMHTGALGLYTDLSFAIDSAKKLQDRGYKEISFIIIGDGVRKESLIRKSEKLGLSQR